MSFFVVIIGIIVGLAVWQLYHKLFNVMYFSFQAILSELFVCAIIGIVIVALAGELLLKFWWVALILAIIVFIGKKMSSE